MKKNPWVWAAVAAAAIFLPLIASADVTVIFDNGANATTTLGSTVSLTGQMTNIGSQTVNFYSLNAIFGSAPAGVSLSNLSTTLVDQAGSLKYLPSSLPTGRVYSGPLLSLNFSDASLTPGDYAGTFYYAGTSSTTGAASTSTNASQNFVVHVLAGNPTGVSAGGTGSSTASSTLLLMPGAVSASGTVPSGLQMPSDWASQTGSGSAASGLQMP
ncbi:MAG: hypothetical protein KGJ93_04635, partial [Patescibacteria group bacterium]|nr:hypothetical protein [Patescibacteria group bacterium]